MGWDWMSALDTVGKLASAWGQYEVGKEQAEIEREKLAYEKAKDVAVAQKTELAQNQLNSALDNVYGVKKKKDDSTSTLTDAYTGTMTLA